MPSSSLVHVGCKFINNFLILFSPKSNRNLLNVNKCKSIQNSFLLWIIYIVVCCVGRMGGLAMTSVSAAVSSAEAARTATVSSAEAARTAAVCSTEAARTAAVSSAEAARTSTGSAVTARATAGSTVAALAGAG